MNAFEQVGEAMILAHEGQREIANAIGRWIVQLFGRLRGDAAHAVEAPEAR